MTKVLMVGHGAFADKHMDGIKNIPGVEVVSICGRREDATKAAADDGRVLFHLRSHQVA